MTDLRAAFHHQAQACAALGSPFMARLLKLLEKEWPEQSALAEKCRGYTGDIGPAGASLPLRIAGGLHALKLTGDAALTALYPPNSPDDDSFRQGILAALHQHDTFLTQWLDNAPQTNELRRSAVLIPAAHLLAARFDLPFRVSELGASGGLNLLWDRYALVAGETRFGPDNPVLTLRPEWKGHAPAPAAPEIAERRGVDLNPLDPSNPDDLMRLSAYLWPDQPERLTNTRAAAASGSAPVDRDDAIDWLARRLTQPWDGHMHLIQNTVAWQYFPEQAQTRGRALIEAAGARATRRAPLAWLQLETDGDTKGKKGAAITLQTWPDGDVQHLGRADFHGRWVDWH